MQYNIPRGTYDILPEQSWRWQKLIQLFRDTAQDFGYQEMVTPIFEVVELFERSSGEGSDIVQKEMYRFQDRKGRWLALRPEGTAPVVRSYIENNLDALGRITKLYYLGPMFRYDRPQAGRYRQFYQYGVELLGSHHPYYDAEIIALMHTYLQRLGLQQVRLEINSVGCPECSKSYDQALISYFEPHKSELCPDCQIRLHKKPRRLLDCKVAACKAIAKAAPLMTAHLDSACREHFEQVQSYLNLLQISYTLNPRIVRGLDYYTHTAFEFLNDRLGAQNALGGGGRYNGLVSQLGGKDMPAVGLAGGFERLLLSLEQEGISLGKKPTPAGCLICLGKAAEQEGLKLLSQLQADGLSLVYDPEKDSLKAALKQASSLGCSFALILGENELTQRMIICKDLKTGLQEQVALSKVLTYLKSVT